MFRDLVIKNRSYRGYDESRAITKEELLSLVDLSRYAASSINQQPLKYHIVWEKDKVAELQPYTKWARGLPELNLPFPGTCPTGFIVICHDASIAPNLTAFLRDIGIVAQTMLLGAVEMGLGGCMIGNFNKADVKELLHLPESVEANLILAIGKPAEEIVITEIGPDESTKYYRDETNKIHYVPKRRLEDILI